MVVSVPISVPCSMTDTFITISLWVVGYLPDDLCVNSHLVCESQPELSLL